LQNSGETGGKYAPSQKKRKLKRKRKCHSRSKFTHIIDAQQPIAGLYATGLIDRSMGPHMGDDQRIVGPAPQRQTQASTFPLHGDLRQLRGHTKAVLGNCCAAGIGKVISLIEVT